MTIRPRLWLARSVLVFTVVLVLLPLVYQVGISFKLEKEMFRHPLRPVEWPLTLENYRRVLQQLPMLRYLANSVIFSLGITGGQIMLAIPAAYAFSFYRFRFKEQLFALVLVSQMVPFVVTYMPNYLLLASWGLLDTLPGMILPMIANGYGIFLLRQHFKTFPRSILEAAQIDGATLWQTLWRIVVPAHLSAISALAIYISINAWNQFVWPLLVATSDERYTLTVAVWRFASSEGGNTWGSMMAASVLTMMPTVALYLWMRKGILQTFREGAVKG